MDESMKIQAGLKASIDAQSSAVTSQLVANEQASAARSQNLEAVFRTELASIRTALDALNTRVQNVSDGIKSQVRDDAQARAALELIVSELAAAAKTITELAEGLRPKIAPEKDDQPEQPTVEQKTDVDVSVKNAGD